MRRSKTVATVMSLLLAGVIFAACDGGTTDDTSTDGGTETTLSVETTAGG
ncbi:MAG TPA: hypothetical protein VHM94_07050 [Acidimicrobiia bacterium]|jgi:hypothetical protein|nr:hypothetical protein [Acidimicrobiia bacterium]